MSLFLDAGALIAVESGSKEVRALLHRASCAQTDVLTTTGVIAQVWRDGARQARLAVALRGVGELEITSDRSRRIGLLLGAAGIANAVDGSLVEAAVDGDEILTSDPDDLVLFARAAGKTLIITPVR